MIHSRSSCSKSPKNRTRKAKGAKLRESIAPGENRKLYGLDLPALLALAHLAFIASDLAFIASDLAFLNAGEVYLLCVTPRTVAGAVLDGPSPLFAAHLAL
jgi:hypothetical protein